MQNSQQAADRKNLFLNLLYLAMLCTFLSIGVLFYDVAENSKYQARNSSCRHNLKRIGEQIALYHKRNKGKMPSTLLEGLKYYEYSKLTSMCMLTSYEISGIGKATEFTYAYRYLPSPKSSDALCWDRKPHVPQHPVLTHLNKPRRNVLFVDGTVKRLDEEEFQSWHLEGKSAQLDVRTRKWIKTD